ncbi:unnamed protein product [Callosobruchus maculatus]|uniref:Nucleoporin Nup133/Nup155-like C-terminal domain-containing protein n=1 Tax=Callosobruchus maculatus TaxID=64391 RepID=A0A653CKT4_CALMS|nr:unnamed protein product [Callosobruchus maculatus]
MTCNTQLSAVVSTNSSTINITNAMDMTTVTRGSCTVQDAQMEERMSLTALKAFVCHCCQIVGMWRILCEHQIHTLIATLPENQQQILQNTTFKDLFMYRLDICSALITALINSYLGDNASVDSISNKLREICPNLYRTEDAAFSKAHELLKATRSVQNVDEKEEMILSALQICKNIAPNVNLNEVCKEFIALKAYKGIIELCAHCAKAIDPDKTAESYYHSDNDGDQEGFAYYQKRMEIYGQILNMLEYLYNEQPPSISCDTYSSGQDTSRQAHVGSTLAQVISDVLECPDEIMHIALYEWMVSKNMTNDLIKISNASLEMYLKRHSAQNPNSIATMDLLWKYYESNNNHAAAAKILNNLASRTGTSVTLKERIAYLARAIMCMRSDKVGYAPYLGVFLRDLEDKMEVAKVQEQILDTITSMQGQIPNAQEAISVLNSGLYEISQLYENFAEPFKLLECQLAIIDCAGYTDNTLIETIWQQILSEELKKSTGSGNDRICQVLLKVKHLARQYGNSAHCFPLNYIVYELERVNARLKGDKHLVPTAIVAMNIPMDKLITVYNNLITISINDHFWQVEENEFHLSEAAAALISCFVNNHDSYNSIEKRKITSLCQDTVATLLSNLYSKPNSDHLVNRLRGIQAKLSRI